MVADGEKVSVAEDDNAGESIGGELDITDVL
jgi:hypothetical protein